MLELAHYGRHVTREPLQTDPTAGIAIVAVVTLIVATVFLLYVAFSPGVIGWQPEREPEDTDRADDEVETTASESADETDSTEANVDAEATGDG
ncbi:hypothetical protein [Natrialbaceae archaeon AArc-T1-2]|uniref:hypothetical protein n=1 Tax=Natrialbaceae archaeon AArc-T1-2 TaxID=3053904 RepID=UPI00255B1E83|nr:hypothetical protein [Natrialbaceae archaeon AArc-T1-2]WIV67212.1 hypothetical protein QQ977_00355 [Natrialbaceae archaeon AArc-T1-2]